MPPIAYHGPWRNSKEKQQWKTWGFVDPWHPMLNKTAHEMRLYYYAATSWMDFLVGLLLHELDALGLAKSTIVWFHSDQCVIFYYLTL